MRRSLGLLVGFFPGLMFLLPAGSAPAQHHGRNREARVEILALEKRWQQAQLAEDIPSMDSLLSDQFLGITASGQVVTKLQQLDRMRTRALDLQRLDLSDTKVKISGNLAVVTSLAQIDGVADGAPLHGAFRYTRVYQRVPGGVGGWKITNFEATHVGRPVAEGTPRASFGGPPGVAPSSRGASPVEPVSPLPPS